MKDRVRLVLVGDAGVGKTSLVLALAEERFISPVPECVTVKEFGANLTADHIHLEIVDTQSFDEKSSSLDQQAKREKTQKELLSADAVLLVYDIDRMDTFEHAGSHWLPWFRLLKITVPVVLVGNKIDIQGDSSTEERMQEYVLPMMHRYPEVETCVECSAKTLLNLSDTFRFAQMAVLHPVKPIFDHDTHKFKPECEKAFKRIFKIVDRDKDGYLSDKELNNFQYYCFESPLAPEELEGVKQVVSHNQPDGIAPQGMTEAGFIYLHMLFVQRGRMETTWTVLRKFGYDDERPEITFLNDYLLPPKFDKLTSPCELSSQALGYLRDLFEAHRSRAGAPGLTVAQLDELFSCSPNGNPWPVANWKALTRTTKDGLITIDGFMSMWCLMTLEDYVKSLNYLAYLGFDSLMTPPLRLLKNRRSRRKRNVINVLLVGAHGSGKTTLLSRLIAHDQAAGIPIAGYRRAAAAVQGESDKFIIASEVPPEEAEAVLSNEKHALTANADVVLFTFDSSSEPSLAFVQNCARSLTDAPIPCILLGTKGDLNVSAAVAERAKKFASDMHLNSPDILGANTVGDDFFKRVASVAASDSQLIISSERRAAHKRSQLMKTAGVIGALLAVGTGVAFLVKYFKKRD